MWVAGGLALWILVVVIGAGPRPDSQTWIGTTGVDVVLITAACVVSIVMLLVLLLSQRPGWTTPKKSLRNPWADLVPLLLMVAAALVWRRVAGDADFSAVGASVEDLFGSLTPDLEDVPEEPAPPTVFELRDLMLVGVVLAVVAATAMALRLRARIVQDPDVATTVAVQEYEHALQGIRQRLASSPDPRTAILLAYADLEAALADLGRGRQPADTVREHQLRVLKDLGLDDRPFQVLAGHYRTARFSSASISESDRETAINALDEALDLLVPQP